MRRPFLAGFLVGAALLVAGSVLFQRSERLQRFASLGRLGHRPVPVENRWAFQKLSQPATRRFLLPLNNPDTVPASEADHLPDDELVVGVLAGEHARAYPWYVLENYHVVNDTIVKGEDEIPVYVALCEKCTGGSAFVPVVEGQELRPLTFQVTGVADGTFQTSDHQTLSQWHPFAGQAVAGPLKGTKLERLPSTLERWDTWREAHPQTDVVFSSARLRFREHGSKTHGPGEPDMPAHMAATANLNDHRVPRNDLVYGIAGQAPGTGLAFPRDELGSFAVVETELQGVPYLVVANGELRVTAFDRRLEGQTLSFEVASREPLRLRDGGGTLWDEWGRALEGPRAGARLAAARGYLTEWYEWVSGFPETTLHSEEP